MNIFQLIKYLIKINLIIAKGLKPFIKIQEFKAQLIKEDKWKTFKGQFFYFLIMTSWIFFEILILIIMIWIFLKKI